MGSACFVHMKFMHLASYYVVIFHLIDTVNSILFQSIDAHVALNPLGLQIDPFQGIY